MPSLANRLSRHGAGIDRASTLRIPRNPRPNLGSRQKIGLEDRVKQTIDWARSSPQSIRGGILRHSRYVEIPRPAEATLASRSGYGLEAVLGRVLQPGRILRQSIWHAAQFQAQSPPMPVIHSIVSLVDNPCNPDSRVMRMAETLVSAGHAVTIVCKHVDPLPRDETVNGDRYLRVPMRARTLRPRSGLFKFRAFTSFVEDTVKKLRPTVIHANDLIALPAATSIGRNIGAKVVYDVHDLYLHGPKKRSALGNWHGRNVEGHNIRVADSVITVSDSLAGHLQKSYRIPLPKVVLNAPDVRAVTGESVSILGLREIVGLPPETPLAVYTGLRHSNRGLDRLVRALGMVPDMHLALVGHSMGNIDDSLNHIAALEQIENRLHILPPVPHDLVTAFISSADFGVIPCDFNCLNDQYSMPHKLFESVFAGLPTAVSDLPEMRRFVELTRAGIVMNARNIEDIAATMRKMAAEKDALRLGPEKVAALKRKYGWPAQAKVLLGVYDRLGAEGVTASPAVEVT